MFDTVKVGKIIAGKRKEHNMTQMQLADALGVTFQAVSNWERGNSMPDISKLPELSELFGCSIEELLGGGKSAGNVEKMTRGEGLSLGELAEIAPVPPPDVVDKAVENALSEDKDDKDDEGDEPGEDEPDDEDDGDDEGEDDAPMRARFMQGKEGADGYIARGGKKPRFFVFKTGKTGDKKEDKRRSKRIRELVCLAPFLSEERLEELVKDLQEDGFTVSELIPLAPFLSEEALNSLAELAEASGGEELVSLAPFLSDEALGKIALRTDISSSELIPLAPFLSEETLETIVLKLLDRGEKVPKGFYPFLSEKAIVEILKHKK